MLCYILELGNSQNRGQVSSVSSPGRDDTRPSVKTGYGYTRGSQEVSGRRRTPNLRKTALTRRNRKVAETRGRPSQTVRPHLSLASALDILEKSGGELQRTGRARTDQRQNDEVSRPNLRQSSRGRKVAAIPPVKNENVQKTQNPGGSNAPGPTGYGYTRGSQEFLESRGSPSRTVRERPSGDQEVQLRQGARGRQVAPIPPVYDYEDYGEIYQDYGDEEEYPESQGGDDETYGREEENYGRGESEDNIEEQANDEQSQGGETSQEETDDGECGPECRNLLHELEHPKEHERCPNAGMVIDIWGYCRYIFHEERRDWAWWQNMRTFVMGQGNSWYNSYRPTAYEEQG